MRRALLIALSISAVACGVVTDPGGPAAPVAGTWSYTGEQVSPARATLGGTMSFTDQTGAQIRGAMDVIETDFRGQQRRLIGPASGHLVDSTTMDFELLIGAATRRHVGRVKGDSVTGSWVEESIDGLPTASGTFRGARRP